MKGKKPKLKELLEKKHIEEGKDADLEKGDFLAILIAMATIFIPAIIAVLAFIFLFIWGWTSFFN